MRHHRGSRRQCVIEPVDFSKRSAWFQGHPRRVSGDPDVSFLLEGRKTRLKAPQGLPKWQPLGPSNIGGRATSVATPPGRPDCVYLGTAGGGVWLSEDQVRIGAKSGRTNGS